MIIVRKCKRCGTEELIRNPDELSQALADNDRYIIVQQCGHCIDFGYTEHNPF